MLYFEDFSPGRVFTTNSFTVEQDGLVEFARSFDPQPFHTDPELAPSLFFGDLVASGWYTAAVCMRLAVESELGATANGLVGIEVSHLGWPTPTRAGDTLRVALEVTDARPSASKPGWGIVRLQLTATNQRLETAMTAQHALWVSRRPVGCATS